MSDICTLRHELKVRIIETLNLVHLKPEEIGDDDHLVEGGFGIDSIDVLELVVMIEQNYRVSIVKREVGERVFASVRALAEHVETHRISR